MQSGLRNKDLCIKEATYYCARHMRPSSSSGLGHQLTGYGTMDRTLDTGLHCFQLPTGRVCLDNSQF